MNEDCIVFERVAFEHWALAQGWDVDRGPSRKSYWNRRTNNAWQGWIGRAERLQTNTQQDRTYEHHR